MGRRRGWIVCGGKGGCFASDKTKKTLSAISVGAASKEEEVYELEGRENLALILLALNLVGF